MIRMRDELTDAACRKDLEVAALVLFKMCELFI